MADAPRFQVGDQCFTGVSAAHQAAVARMEPFNTVHDFGTGPVQTIAIPGWPSGGDGDGIYPDGTETVTWVYRGVQDGWTAYIEVPWYFSACQTDSVSSERIADLFSLWPVLLLVLVLIWGAKQIHGLFTNNRQDA